MQADIEMVHQRERHRQNQGDGDRDDDAAAQAEREEADQQHDQHRFGQGAHELVDRTADRGRLVGDLVQIQPDRQGRGNAPGGRLEVATQGNDVTAAAHRHGNADRIDAVEAHARLRRIDEAAADFGDVAEAEQATGIAADAEIADGFHGIQGTAGTQVDAIGCRLETAAGRYRILRSQGLLEFGEGHAEGGELGVRCLDVDFRVLLANQFNLGHVGNAQQFELDALGILAQVVVVESLATEGVDVAEGISKLVIEERPAHVGRQA